jgi:hypothetical protein
MTWNVVIILRVNTRGYLTKAQNSHPCVQYPWLYKHCNKNNFRSDAKLNEQNTTYLSLSYNKTTREPISRFAH